ncbi:hypothetical protein E3N88_22751 [Mikania micrantha]|uniref:ARID domain-containing protein n=1 Tax=Mikania micrantha TaxID=192012 RepID=A0A5N6ND18_9ASTR|nr:hypothetical protein E3N88_22751 [Mikania micrantha]
MASEPNEPGTCEESNYSIVLTCDSVVMKNVFETAEVVVQIAMKKEAGMITGGVSGGCKGVSRENPVAVFGQVDQGEHREDDREDHVDSSMENLCKSVTGFKIEKDISVIGDKGRKTVKIFKEFAVSKEEDKWSNAEYASQSCFETKINNDTDWDDVIHMKQLCESNLMWDHFRRMELDDEKDERLKQGGKGMEPGEDLEPKKVNTIEDMVVFLDLLAAINKNMLHEEFIKIRLNKMVNWFNKYIIRKSDKWVPMLDGKDIDLYHLYMVVQLNGGKNEVTINEFWSFVAAEMGLDSRKGFQLMLLYNDQLEMIEWNYKNLKEKTKTSAIIHEQGEPSEGIKKVMKEKELPFKKRKVSDVRDWPPGCGPALKKR